MQKVMVLSKKDLKRIDTPAEAVSLKSFRKERVSDENTFDFIIYQEGRDLVVLKSHFGPKKLCSMVKWIDSQSRWLSLAKIV